MGRFASAEGEEANGILVEIDFAADESVEPVWVDRKGVSEYLDASLVVGASEVDDFSTGSLLKVELPPPGD